MAQFPVRNIPKIINAAFDRVGSRGILPASIKNSHLAEGTVTSSRLGTYLRFTTDIVFSSTDEDTAAWTTGTINWSDGTTTETIVSGNTGNITATTYIFYDGSKTGELQTTTTPASAVGDKKILIAIVETGAAGKDCKITTIGAAGLVVSNITTNQIQANTLVVGNMASSVSDRFFTDSTRKTNIEAWRHATDATLIDGGDIYTNTVTATQIAASTITTSELNFTPVQSTDVIAKINASAEGITIEADNITIAGATTFTSGWAGATNAEADINVLNTTNAPAAAGADVTGDNTAAAISGQGALATLSAVGAAQCNTTIIDGGKIITGLLTADNVQAGTLTGRTVQTASSGQRIVIDGTNNYTSSYNSGGVLRSRIEGDVIKLYDDDGVLKSQIEGVDVAAEGVDGIKIQAGPTATWASYWFSSAGFAFGLGGSIGGDVLLTGDGADLVVGGSFGAPQTIIRGSQGSSSFAHGIDVSSGGTLILTADLLGAGSNPRVVVANELKTGYSFFIGDDSYIRDINIANTFGVYGQQNGTWGNINAAAFNVQSSKDIKKIKPTKVKDLKDEILGLEFSEFLHDGEKKGTLPHIGVATKNTPIHIRDRETQDFVSLGDLGFLALFGAKEALSQINELKAEVAQLRLELQRR